MSVGFSSSKNEPLLHNQSTSGVVFYSIVGGGQNSLSGGWVVVETNHSRPEWENPACYILHGNHMSQLSSSNSLFEKGHFLNFRIFEKQDHA